MLVHAIIVTYNSNIDSLNAILGILVNQCGIIIVDNSDDDLCILSIKKLSLIYGATYLPMFGNKGLGKAQNDAILFAWENGSDAILLLDDDSIPSPDLIYSLNSCKHLYGSDFAVFCSSAIDQAGRNISNGEVCIDRLTVCRDMMSSGSLISRKVFDYVGPFDESLFIDCVDFEWGWRAQNKGVPIFLYGGTSIIHKLGEDELFLIRIPSPIRHYYQFRNILNMIASKYSPLSWKLKQIILFPCKFLAIFTMPNCSKRLRFAFIGVFDAFRQHSGKYIGNFDE